MHARVRVSVYCSPLMCVSACVFLSDSYEAAVKQVVENILSVMLLCL